MKRFQWSQFASTLALIVALGAGAAYLSQAQTGGLRREPGIIMTTGQFIPARTCVGTVKKGDLLQLDSTGGVLAASTSTTTGIIGVAAQACAATATLTVPSSTPVQVSGVATVVASASIAVNDRVGAPTVSGGEGRVKTLTTTLAGIITAGTTAVTGSTATGVLTITSGSQAASIIAGRALTGATTAGDSISILLGQQ